MKNSLIHLSLEDLRVLHAQVGLLQVRIDHHLGTVIAEPVDIKEEDLRRIAREADLVAARCRYRIRTAREQRKLHEKIENPSLHRDIPGGLKMFFTSLLHRTRSKDKLFFIASPTPANEKEHVVEAAPLLQ